MLLYIGLVTVLPMSALLLVSLQPFWSTRIVWSDLSLDNYRALFASGSQITKAFEASLILGAVCATVLILGTGLVEFYIALHGGMRGRFLNVLMTLPASLPHIVVGIALLVTLGVGHGRLGGTYLLILLAYVVMLVPPASRAAGAAVGQVGRGLWEASVVAGAGGLRTYVRILLPLAVGGLLAGWVVVFVFAFGEVTASMFLSTSPNPVVGPILLYEWVNSVSVPEVMALALLVTVTQTAVVLVARLGLRHWMRDVRADGEAVAGFAGSERVGAGA
jgi:iron(III) transport system permease protein